MRRGTHCKDCGRATDRVIAEGQRSYFLCADCEYLRMKPDAATGIAHPQEMRKLPLQKETLW